MSSGKIIVTGVVFLFIFTGWTVTAQSNFTCKDINFLPAVTEKYPAIADACIDVIKRNEMTMAKVKLVVTSVKDGKVYFRFMEHNNKLSGVYKVNLEPEWDRVIKDIRLNDRDLNDRITLNAYIPYDRWTIMREGETGPELASTSELYKDEDSQNLATIEERYKGESIQGVTGSAEANEARGSSATQNEKKQTSQPMMAAAMPATAGPLPLIGLLGGVFLALGSGIRFLRNRFLNR